ncbi:Small-conductance mechanosensitive channel [Thalassocella blandensis]|nr:Small-conductance mechanosensitive channel [Thalassocella blandensis]
MTVEIWFILLGILLAYLIAKNTLKRLIHRIGKERKISRSRIHYVVSVLNFSLAVLAIMVAGGVAGVGYKQFGFFLSSVIAVLGVALFAQWSILSNLTASILVFFFFPYRVGDWVKILDGENTVEGRIHEISLFHVILKSENDLITFPNALVFQKAVVIQRNKSNSHKAVTEKSPAEQSPDKSLVENAAPESIKSP